MMFALDQIDEAIGGATDDDYIKEAIAASKSIRRICKKFKAAEEKQDVKKIIKGGHIK